MTGINKMSDIKISVVKIYLHETAILEQSILACAEYVDKIILDHGCWSGFTQSEPPAPVYANEMAHRQHAIDQVANGDYMFILDSDDITFGDWSKLRWLLNHHKPHVVWVKNYYTSGDNTIKPRIMLKTEGLQYKFNHYTLYAPDKDGLLRRLAHRRPEPKKHKYYESPVSYLHLDKYIRNEAYEKEMAAYFSTKNESLETKELL